MSIYYDDVIKMKNNWQLLVNVVKTFVGRNELVDSPLNRGEQS